MHNRDNHINVKAPKIFKIYSEYMEANLPNREDLTFDEILNNQEAAVDQSIFKSNQIKGVRIVISK